MGLFRSEPGQNPGSSDISPDWTVKPDVRFCTNLGEISLPRVRGAGEISLGDYSRTPAAHVVQLHRGSA